MNTLPVAQSLYFRENEENEVHDVDNINPAKKESCENIERVRKIEMGAGDGHGDDFNHHSRYILRVLSSNCSVV